MTEGEVLAEVGRLLRTGQGQGIIDAASRILELSRPNTGGAGGPNALMLGGPWGRADLGPAMVMQQQALQGGYETQGGYGPSQHGIALEALIRQQA